MGGSRVSRKSLRAYGPWYPFTRGYGALHPLSDFLLVGVCAVTAAAAFVFVDIHVVSMVSNK